MQAFQLSALVKAEQALERLAALEDIYKQADTASFSTQPPGSGATVDPLAPMKLIDDLVADKKLGIDTGETLSPEKQRELDDETESMQVGPPPPPAKLVIERFSIESFDE